MAPSGTKSNEQVAFRVSLVEGRPLGVSPARLRMTMRSLSSCLVPHSNPTSGDPSELHTIVASPGGRDLQFFITDMTIEGHAAEKIGGMGHRTGLGSFIGIENSADGPEVSISTFPWSRTIQFYPKRRLSCAQPLLPESPKDRCRYHGSERRRETRFEARY